MIISEILHERAFSLPDGEVLNLHKNPTATAIDVLIKKSRAKELRGLIVDDSSYWWDAFDATHAQVGKALIPDFDSISEQKFWEMRMHLLQKSVLVLFIGITKDEFEQHEKLNRTFSRLDDKLKIHENLHPSHPSYDPYK